MIIFLPYSKFYSPGSGDFLFYHRLQLLPYSDSIYRVGNIHLYCRVVSWAGQWFHTLKIDDNFNTAEEAMTNLDHRLKERGYILCNTEEQVNKYRLLL